MDVSLESFWVRRTEIFQALLERLIALSSNIRKTSSRAALLPVSQPDQAVSSVWLAPGITAEDILSVAAASFKLSLQQPIAEAILRKARASNVSIIDAEDGHSLSGGGLHCWVSGVPTLVGPREVIARFGLDATSAPSPTPGTNEIFVAQGSKLLGCIRISEL